MRLFKRMKLSKFPDDETGDALNEFVKNGFDLSKPMQIDFFLAVLSMKKGIKISQIVEKLGFNTSVEQDEETQEWTCYCTKIMIPEYTEIIKIEEELNNIAKLYDGYIDGFGSYGN